jgi:hypothetical protein
MNTGIESLVSAIESWLKDQETPEPESSRWYALGSLKGFAAAIKADGSAPSVAKAVWGLSHQLSDQCDWPAQDCKTIGEFLAAARRMEKS